MKWSEKRESKAGETMQTKAQRLKIMDCVLENSNGYSEYYNRMVQEADNHFEVGF